MAVPIWDRLRVTESARYLPLKHPRDVSNAISSIVAEVRPPCRRLDAKYSFVLNARDVGNVIPSVVAETRLPRRRLDGKIWLCTQTPFDVPKTSTPFDVPKTSVTSLHRENGHTQTSPRRSSGSHVRHRRNASTAKKTAQSVHVPRPTDVHDSLVGLEHRVS
ncbi:hypothetical protein B0H10DRAFT_1958004 [Mycena sp. CBHHK59/15]|nr:hypothetical protein B0H10DRAFT_1958004 [Mycena sp. CBHHK59/15]